MRMRALLLSLTLVALTGCGLGGFGAGTPSDTHRGEADAIDPARNVTLICEKDKNANTTTVTTTITNNCDKSVHPVEPAPVAP